MPPASRKPLRRVRRLSDEELIRNLQKAGRRAREARQELQEANEERDLAIKAASLRGLSRRRVAKLAGVTVGRVQQIVGLQDQRHSATGS